MSEICQRRLPFAPWMHQASRRLPGVQPVSLEDWIVVDDAYRAQMARRVQLMADRRDAVHKVQAGAQDAARELLDHVMARLPALGFQNEGAVHCPDGRVVQLDPDQPLITLGHLVQEDFVILQRQGDVHVMTGAILCFPASWSLAEKFGHPLDIIHDPVDEYDAQLAMRVERLFSAIRPEQPLMRANALRYANPELFHPSRWSDRGREGGKGSYIRSERQTLVRLPKTGAVVFSIHTFQVREENLTPEQAEGLQAHPIVHAEAAFR